MVLSKELRPVQSKKLYEEKSKEMLKNVSLGAGKVSSLRVVVIKCQIPFCILVYFVGKPYYMLQIDLISTYCNHYPEIISR